MENTHLHLTRSTIYMFSNITKMIHNEDGATMVEYGLMVALVALVAIVAVSLLGTHLSTLFNTIATTI
jgi:pilus assembly protein Flp/PilA